MAERVATCERMASEAFSKSTAASLNLRQNRTFMEPLAQLIFRIQEKVL